MCDSETVNDKTSIPPPDWEALIEVIAKEIIEERSPARILQVRAKLYDLLTHCIPATTILKVRVPQAMLLKLANDRSDSHIQAHAQARRHHEGRDYQMERFLRASNPHGIKGDLSSRSIRRQIHANLRRVSG